MQLAAPTRLYVPGRHARAVGDVEPAAHAYPALHWPEHAEDVAPVALPNSPAGQLPLHAALVRPVALPKVPTGQDVHDPAPPVLKVPSGQVEAVAFGDPKGHAYPGAHGPSQVLAVAPPSAKRPRSHGPEHWDDARPAEAPYRPGSQLEHADAPTPLY